MIKTDSSIKEKKKAKIPHELFTINAIVVHLFLPATVMKFGDSEYALGVPLIISLIIIGYTFLHTKKAKIQDSYFVFIHWQWSMNWYKPVLISYVVAIFIILLGFIISYSSDDNMAKIIDMVFLRLSLAPPFFTILVAFVVMSGAMFNAGCGEIPEKLMLKYPQN